MTAGSLVSVEIRHEPSHRLEEALDACLLFREFFNQELDVAVDIPGQDADIVIRENGAIEDFVRDELNVPNLREALDEVEDAIALSG